MKWSLAMLTFLGLVLSIAVGCSAPVPTPTPVPPPTPTINPQAAILAGAQSEGALTVYMSLNESEAKPLLKKFSDKYPFVNVQLYRATSADLVQKAISEGKAGQKTADVYEMDGMDMLQLLNEKLLAVYKSPELASFPDGAKHPWGYYAAGHINAVVIAYNTKLVKPEEAPKKLTDLLDPKWSGKIALEAEDWPMMPYTSKVMGETAASNFWSKLAQLNPRAIKGHTELATAVTTGEVAITPNAYAHRIEALKKKGEPIEWVKTDPVYSYLQDIAISANAPHPNAARLFDDWIFSAEGQGELANIGRIPVRPGVKANPATLTDNVRFYFGDPAIIPDPVEVRSEYVSLLKIK